MTLFRASLIAVLFLTSKCHARADPAPVIHYAPSENLERIDVALIGNARQSVDMAAYVLTDWPVIEALARAAGRGVKVRVYLDGAELSKDEAQAQFNELASTPGVEMRVKRGDAFMHLKSYVIDGKTLRTGAANFSASGLKRQDNDLIVLESPEAAAAFERDFMTKFVCGSRVQ